MLHFSWVVHRFFSDDRDRNFTVKWLPGTLSSRLGRPLISSTGLEAQVAEPWGVPHTSHESLQFKIEGVHGIKPQVTSDKLLNSPSHLPYICM